jgi:hypothetical protein
MKKIIFLIFIVLSFHGLAQERQIIDKPKVDKRVELLSIVFRLAGNSEYNMSGFKLYTDRIEEHFKPYRNHELIQFAKKLRDENGVSYDAVMSMAIHLDENLNPIVAFTDGTPEARWGNNGNTFVALLKQFYKDAKCEDFFRDNTDLYTEAMVRFLPVYENLDLSWYNTFYGKEPSEKFVIVIGLANGGGSYGPSLSRPDLKREVYSIMGAWSVDSLGMVTFNKDGYFPTLLHEFNHSFVNHLLEANKTAFKDSGEKLYEILKTEMSAQAYGNWETMLNEALVRASVIKYMKDHHFEKPGIENQINDELGRSFLWIKELVGELDNYDAHRDIYPTLGDYIPNLAKAYQSYTEKVVQFDNKRPKVESIKEFTNGDFNVDAAITTITVKFDRALLGQGFSIFPGNKGKAIPSFGKPSYSEDKKSVILEVKLEKDKEYQFILTGKNFKSPEGVGMKNYEVNFKTAK